jgi:hypothetical protein
MILLGDLAGHVTHWARPFRAAASLALLSVLTILTIAISGCASSFRPAHRLVPGPSGAIAASPLFGDRIAVLAGDDRSKGVFIIDLRSGEVMKSFGVTREATGMVSEGGDGPLLITVGGYAANGKGFGAVERWTLAGSKSQVVPMPTAAMGITRVTDGIAYVMLANHESRSALSIAVPAMKIGKPIPLDAGAKSLEQCKIGSSDYLVYSGGTQGTIVVRELETGIVLRSSVVADNPTCLTGRDQVFAIEKSFAARTIAVLTLPGLLQATVVPASNDAAGLYESQDHHLIALNATSRLSNIETFPDDAFDVKAAPTAAK